MLTISPSSIAKSSLEAMLDTLQQRDESEKLKDLPPALPWRPKSNCRALPPSTRRPLVIGENGVVNSGKVELEEVKKTRRKSFGGEKIIESDCRDSPFVFSMDEIGVEVGVEENGGVEPAKSSPVKVPRSRETEIDDNIDYFIKHSFLLHRNALRALQDRVGNVVLLWIPVEGVVGRSSMIHAELEDSCGSGGSSYRRTRNGELSPPFRLTLWS